MLQHWTKSVESHLKQFSLTLIIHFTNNYQCWGRKTEGYFSCKSQAYCNVRVAGVAMMMSVRMALLLPLIFSLSIHSEFLMLLVHFCAYPIWLWLFVHVWTAKITWNSTLLIHLKSCSNHISGNLFQSDCSDQI